MMVKKIPLLIGSLLIISQAYGQLFKPTLTASILEAPEKVLENVKKVAVFDFENKSASWHVNDRAIGSQMSDNLVSAMLEEERGKTAASFFEGMRTNIYTVMERDKLSQILEEQKLGASGLVDESSAVEIGKLAGVDALIMGDVSYTEKFETDKQNKTETLKRKDGSTYQSAYVLYTAKRTITARSNMKIVSVKTGEILGTKSSSASRVSTKNARSYVGASEVSSAEELARQASQVMASELSGYFNPSFRSYTFSFEKVKNKEYKDRVKEAQDDLKNGRISKAFALYDALYQEDSYNPDIISNLAALYEIGGDFEKAKELYEQVVNMDPSNKSFAEGLNRSNNNLELIKKLAILGIVIQKHEFKASNANVLAERVETKGNKNKRYDVFEEPSSSSKLITKVPGGLEFKVVEKGDDWIKIKLVTGKEGYINRADVQEGK